MLTLLIFISVFTVSYCIATRCLCDKSVLHIHDVPNERSLHSIPTPKSGGLAIVVAIIVGWLLATALYSSDHSLWYVIICLALLSAIGLLDSLINLSPLLRIVSHFVAAFFLIQFMAPIVFFDDLAVVNYLLSLLFVVWFINMYNFMDGMDGFAGGMAVIGFVTLAIILLIQGSQLHAIYAISVCIAVLAFMIFNYPPARLFMGDSGSIPLGYIGAYFSIWGELTGAISIWVVCIIFSPFLVDATATLFRRIVRGERVWRAHKTHFYQRLVEYGWSHEKTLKLEYVLMLLSSIVAILVSYLNPLLQFVIALDIFMLDYVILKFTIERLKSYQLSD